jgi:L-ascorbate metabolism protein UlaG (beta-lactamase superfamily)
VTRLRLRAETRLGVPYHDRTPLGSPVGERLDEVVRAAYAPVIEYAQQHGYAELVAAAPAILAEAVLSNGFTRLAQPDATGAWRLRPELLYPEVARAQPMGLTVMREDTDRMVRATLPLDHWPRVHALIAALARSGCDSASPTLHPDLRALINALEREGLVEAADDERVPDPRLVAADLTFLGHNTVVVRSRTTRVIIDPLLFPCQSTYPPSYQPLQPRDLGPIDAVLLTHSHPDHFHPPSLLQFAPETHLIVPHVERETVLAVALAQRLRELGFSHVSVVDWGQMQRVGDIEVHALPFFGEQPSESDVLHPEVRNWGNTYLVRTPTFSAVFLADSGRDARGDVRDLALRMRLRLGAVDVVFSGYRGWLTYPIQLLFSSVARFLLFVPPWLWGIRHQLMTTPSEAVDIAERWGARFLVPYADGGAPWHWAMGLGPNVEEVPGPFAAFDPHSERVRLAAERRSQSPDGEVLRSPVCPLLLRPNDSLCDIAGTPTLLRLSGHAWPYPEQASLRATSPPS